MKKQSEVDYFINKNAKKFLREQFNIWLYQYVFSGESEWTEKRIKQLQVLKDIAFKIIDFISQFEDELVKIWNKPKFVLNSNYVITLDRIADKSIELVEKILRHKDFDEQVKEWKDLGIVDSSFKVEGIFKNSPFIKGWHSKGMTGYSKLPYNPKLKEKARKLRKAGNLSEVLLWNKLKKGQMLGFDFTRQQIIGDYIVDFHCPKLNLVIEIDGESHDFKGEYDEKRDKFLESLGLTVLHVNDKEVKKSLNEVLERIKNWVKENTPSASQTPLLIKGEWRHLPIDTRYFKDLELEILGLFDDLDSALDGWLIKSENYQALNTILPKFKEKVQTIYIDPPFNKEQDADYLYNVKYKDSTWISMLENRLWLAKTLLNDKGSIFVRCDYNGNMYVRMLLNEIFNMNFKNEIILNRSGIQKEAKNKFLVATDSLFLFSKNEIWQPKESYEFRETEWLSFVHYPGERKTNKERIVFGYHLLPPTGRHWGVDQKLIDNWITKKWIRFRCKLCGYEHYEGIWEKCPKCNKNEFVPEIKNPPKKIDSNWTTIPSYSQDPDFPTRNAEELLQRVIESTSNIGDLVMDFFLGSGTATAVAQKLKRKWIGVEMGEHFWTVVLPRMKKVLAYDKSGISKEKDVKEIYNENKAGGFFKYYELEQYEDTLRKVKYEDSDFFDNPYQDPYNQYVFMRDLKMLEALEIDYENNKVKVDLTKLYPGIPRQTSSATPFAKGNIDIPETLSNLLGKWIKKITPDYVEFEDGEKINLKELDYCYHRNKNPQNHRLKNPHFRS